MFKSCCVCKLFKSINDFYKNKNSKDLHAAQCKECSKQYRNSHKEERKLYNSSTKEYRKQYYIRNSKHINELKRRHYFNNIELMQKQLRNRYNNNKNKYLLFSHKYYENNKSMLSIKRKLYRSNNKLSIYMRNRQRRLKLNCNHITQKQINTLIANSNNTCHYCGIELNNLILNIDHFIPLSKGGPHTINNLVVSCKNCNLRKGNKLPEEWLKTLNKEK